MDVAAGKNKLTKPADVDTLPMFLRYIRKSALQHRTAANYLMNGIFTSTDGGFYTAVMPYRSIDHIRQAIHCRI